MKDKFWRLLFFYIKESLFSKTTLISSLVVFFLVLGLLGFEHFFSGNEAKNKIAVITDSRYSTLIIEMKANSPFDIVEGNAGNLQSLKAQVESGDLGGILMFDKQSFPSIAYIYKSAEDQEVLTYFTQKLQQAFINQTITENQVDESVARQLLTPITVNKTPIERNQPNFMLVYFFVFFMYILITTFGQMTANTIASEKSSRVIEIMISKIKPIYMMYARIFSILIIGLIQFAVTGLAYFIVKKAGWISKDGISFFGAEISISEISPKIILLFILFFILGYLLYALMYAAVGAMVSRTEEVGSVAFPIMISIMGAFFIGIKSLFDPASTIVQVSSYIPIFSPIVTFSRVSSGEADDIEIIVACLILMTSILIVGSIASRIYINGVMNNKQKVGLKSVIPIKLKG
ncbi:ABC transporter permease [Neobacillus mesonae]|uniref:ABC transporter permease n=1 Tax=Neobacillus mesonae TaxID=1193713 RepID=UPI002E1F8AEF|nr:ABC transporter permease [Neobacillus mesonae]MED4206668.1 ABC transporter permease [Neobacillus mesonae]